MVKDRDSQTDCSPARRWGSLAVMMGSLLVVAMDMTIMTIAIPAISRELNPSTEQLLWIVDSYSLVVAGLLVVMSALSDRFGRKRVLMLGYLTFSLASAGIVLADSAGDVIAIRLLLGVGGSMIMPTTLSMIRVLFTDPQERATAIGAWSAVAALGIGVGPILGGVLLHFFSWHSAFLVNLPLMLLAVVLAGLVLPESTVAVTKPLDWFAALLSMVGVAEVLFAIKRFGELKSLASWDAWATLVTGIALLTWFTLRCLHREEPLLDLRLFTSRSFSAGILTALVTMFSTAAAFLLLTQWLLVVDKQTPTAVGFMLLPVTIISGVAALLIAPLAGRAGTRRTLVGGLLLATAGMLVLALYPGRVTLGLVMISLGMIGVGMGTLALGSLLIMAQTSEDTAGNAAALEEISYELGNVLGVATLGAISGAYFSHGVLAAAADLDVSVDQGTLKHASESVAAAVQVAGEHGLTGFVHEIEQLFTDSVRLAFLAGGAAMLVLSALIAWLTPKNVDITKTTH